MSGTIAGHTFIDGPGGRVCKYCTRTWIYLLDRRDQWVPGAPGLAHSGNLTSTEVDELNAEVDRIYACLIAVSA